MALNLAIRRAASRVVPLAVRASAGSQRSVHRHSAALLYTYANNCSRNLLPRTFPSFLHRYSTKPSSDEKLLRVIEDEIQCAAESLEADQGEEVPKGFPFEIEDTPGQSTITLKREYQGETISVEVHMPDLVTGDENENDDDNDEEGEEKANQSNIPLIVKISKKSGPSLEFGCSAYPDEIAIESLSVKNPENTEDDIAYEGPDFQDLDENLQKAFHKYLEVRGIKPSTTNFLHGYMVDKDSREYVTWLKNLQKFVRA
ncbi:hypothetical protein RD792_003571 [Penstemon davidsonii]|uniref:Mitochondrial glycoprotein n=1 Tax=Penstemon davidsonii TaxID=160366 RepID=A0ABR0DF54_9LAMI|nr:hypothetical protein RD792_003571 [Penstemon davidsonii]